MKTRVVLQKGDDRYENILNCLHCLGPEIKERMKMKKRVVIKPNFVSDTCQLAATHVDAVRAFLDFCKPFYSRTITIAEGSYQDTEKAFKNFHYYKLRNRYNIKFLDLNEDETCACQIFDKHLNLVPAKMAKTICQSDFLISICPPKTHDSVQVTLSLKNIVVSGLHDVWQRTSVFGRHLRKNLHQGYKAINLSLALLAKKFHPHLSIIDGFEGMEGEGPTHGSAVKTRWAIASLDFLAADSLACLLMGFELKEIGYLTYCSYLGLGETDIKKMEILGKSSLAKLRRKFKPHSTRQKQLSWRLNQFEKQKAFKNLL